MRLWTVEVRTNIVVRAKDPREAARLARDAIRTEDVGQFDTCVMDLPKPGEVYPMPRGWDDSCIPYGHHEQKTIHEWQDVPGPSAEGKETKT